MTQSVYDTFEQGFAAFTQAHPAPAILGQHLCWFGNPWECGALFHALTCVGGGEIALLVDLEPDTAKMAARLDLRPYAVRKTFMGMYRGVLIFETATGGGFTWADVDAEGTT